MKASIWILLASVMASGIFTWGTHVGRNDARLFASEDAEADRITQVACGRQAWIAKRGQQRRCLYINPDESAVTRAVFDNPIGEL